MNLLHCYEILGLTVDAELPMIKATYRRLARCFHPDVNAGDRQAQERFIQINQAYRILLEVFPELGRDTTDAGVTPIAKHSAPHRLSALDHRLKWQTYRSLQQCLRQSRFARAIALTEGLAQRLPDDAEVRQWQGVIYLSWASQLLRQGKNHQARTYLRKAMLADPHNVRLKQRIERIMATVTISAV